MAAKNRNTKRSTRLDGAKLYRLVQRAPALFPPEEIVKLERKAQERDWVRRAMWHVLSRPGRKLIEMARDNRGSAVALACLYDAMGEYRKNLKGLDEFVDAAEARLMIAIARRPDMDSVLADARRDNPGRESDPEFQRFLGTLGIKGKAG